METECRLGVYQQLEAGKKGERVLAGGSCIWNGGTVSEAENTPDAEELFTLQYMNFTSLFLRRQTYKYSTERQKF